MEKNNYREKITENEMTNEEYRVELQKIFENIHENYKLRWFYRFIVAKLKGSK